MTWLVVGGGISGTAAAKLLKKLGYEVTLSEVKSLPAPTAAALQALGIKIHEGAQEEDLLAGVKGIVLSPGVPPDIPLLNAAKDRGIPIKSEIDLALQHFGGEVVGITGTNGKSTTCAMTAHVLNAAGESAVAAGNFGKPPSEILYNGENYGVWVLELSSYQLETSKMIRPKVATFTSFTPDHLKRHKTLANYFRSKWRLFTALPGDGIALLSQEAYEAAKSFKETIPNCQLQKIVRPLERGFSKNTAIWTKHDLLNASFAMEAAAFILGKAPESLYNLLDDFHTLTHRCELIGTISGQLVINDSKSTNVDATLRALESVPAPCLLLLGGQGKDESFAPLRQFTGKIKRVICFGASGAEIAAQLPEEIVQEKFATLQGALAALKGDAKKLKAPILFSPGCASFDEFSNFEERGDFFRTTLKPVLDFK